MYNSMNRLSLIVCLVTLAASAAFSTAAQAQPPADHAPSAVLPPTTLPSDSALEALADAQRALQQTRSELSADADNPAPEDEQKETDAEQSKQASAEVLTTVLAEAIAESILETAGVQTDQPEPAEDLDWAEPSLAEIDPEIENIDEFDEFDETDLLELAELDSRNAADDEDSENSEHTDDTLD